jgi:hypothetical protein
LSRRIEKWRNGQTASVAEVPHIVGDRQ